MQQRTYEIMFIVRPDATDEDVDKLVTGFENTVNNGGGTVTHTERMGRRRLAYIVRKFQDGIYVRMDIQADGALVHEVERRLRVSEPVIKFITVRTDEENKRLDKVKAHRAAHQKRSAVEAANAAAESAPTGETVTA